MRPAGSALLPSCNFSTIILSVLILSAVAFGAPPDRINGPIISSQRVSLSAGVPMRARPQYDQGPVDPSLKLSYMTLLTVPSDSQQEAINQLLAEQQDPRSPRYHQWLTPEQYGDRFGLSSNDIQKLAIWLQSQGFTVVRVARARNFIVFSGTAAQAESAFQTQIHTFDINGERRFSNVTLPSIPAAVTGIVTGIRGLSNFPARSHALRAKPDYTEPVSGGNHYWIAPGDITTMYDLEKLYNAGITGSGYTLAVMGQTDVYLADLNDFRSVFNLPQQITGCTFFSGTNVIQTCDGTYFQYVLVEGDTDPGVPNSIQDDLTEADIDLEWSNAVAQDAKIIYVNAPDANGNGVADAWYFAIDQDISPVITLSYGLCELFEANEGAFASDEAELSSAGMYGITFMNSSGDQGATECEPNNYGDPSGTLATLGLAVSYPASSQYVTGVGGTMIPDSEYTSTYWNTGNGPTGGSVSQYVPEQGWNDDQEFGIYCAANPTDSFCTSKSITSWQTAQAALAITAGGGGASNCTTINNETGVCISGSPQPSYQTGLSLSDLGQTTAVRFSPDVSLLASVFWPGFIICTAESELPGYTGSASICANGLTGANGFFSYGYTFGGTSIASPMFAGIVTLLNQDVVQSGLQTKPGLGNINPTLYALAATPANGAFNLLASSTSTGSNGVYCEPGTPNDASSGETGWPPALVCPAAVAPATEGFFGYTASKFDAKTNYNLVTGLGSVDAYNLAHAWPSSTTPSFTLSVTATPDSTPENTNVVWNGTLTATNGYSNTVTLTCGTGAPSTCNISPSSITPSSSGTAFTVTVGSGTAGTYSFNIQGTDGTITQTQAVSLTVVAPGFTLSAAPTSVSIIAGSSGGTSTITVADQGGFTGSVGLAASGLPSGVTASFNPSSTASTSVLTLTASGSAAAGGPTTVTITGTSGSIMATTTVALTVSQNFSVPATLTNPATAEAGQNTSTTMALAPVGGGNFTSNVTYTCSSGLPTGATCSFSPTQISSGTGGQTVTITVQTAGPFTGAAGGAKRGEATRKLASQKQQLWLPLSLPLAGIVMAGLFGGGLPRRYKIVGLCLALTITGFLVACGGGSSSTPPPAVVTVSPSSATTLFPNLTGFPDQTQQFSAMVSNSSSQTVTWAVTGGSGNGTIDSTGLYTAPATLPSPANVQVTATSTATTTPGTATVNLQTPTPTGPFPIIVTITEGGIQHTTTFTLTVTD
jgi:hypothetical protein